MNKGRIATILILLAGLINFAPIIGVLSGARIESLYGIKLDDPALEILLRHRAVLFGLLGGFMVVAAFKKSLQSIAIIGGLIAMLSFIGLYYTSGTSPSSLLSIVYADFVGTAFLSLAIVIRLVGNKD